MRSRSDIRAQIALFAALLYTLLPGYAIAQDFRTVRDGVEYAEVTKEISGLKVNMNLLRLDLSKVRLDVVHAMDAAIGVEKTSSIAIRHGALAAINAGFFRLDNSIFAGDSAGVLQIDDNLLSESLNDRIALFIHNGPNTTETQIADLNIHHAIKTGGRKFDLSGTNRERKAGEAVLFTPEFHRTTLTDGNGTEIVVRSGKIVQINTGRGSSIIPEKGYVISVSGKMRDEIMPFVKVGKKIEVSTLFYSMATAIPAVTSPRPDTTREMRLLNDLIDSEDIVGGSPQLIKSGRIDITWEREKRTRDFVDTRHPRTAVAKLKDGKFLAITVDGRSEASGGIGLQDLAEYLLSLGAVDAMNLDGGGSTTMWLDGKVVNKPSDKEGERKVSDALIVRKR